MENRYKRLEILEKKQNNKKLSIDLGKQVPGNICTEKQTHGAQKRIQNVVSEMDLQHKKGYIYCPPFLPSFGNMTMIAPSVSWNYWVDPIA